MLDKDEIAKGNAYVAHAQAEASHATPREKGMIAAMAVYYGAFPDNLARARAYSEKMDALHAAYPDDPDLAAFDGLAIIEGAPTSTTRATRARSAPA